MAFVSQELKKQIAPKVKAILSKYGLKGTLSVRHNSTLVLNISEGAINFLGDTKVEGYIQVNHYHLDRSYTGKALDALKELNEAMNAGNWDKSDMMTDYFNVGWYVDINIGRWNKPYTFRS